MSSSGTKRSRPPTSRTERTGARDGSVASDSGSSDGEGSQRPHRKRGRSMRSASRESNTSAGGDASSRRGANRRYLASSGGDHASASPARLTRSMTRSMSPVPTAGSAAAAGKRARSAVAGRSRSPARGTSPMRASTAVKAKRRKGKGGVEPSASFSLEGTGGGGDESEEEEEEEEENEQGTGGGRIRAAAQRKAVTSSKGKSNKRKSAGGSSSDGRGKQKMRKSQEQEEEEEEEEEEGEGEREDEEVEGGGEGKRDANGDTGAGGRASPKPPGHRRQPRRRSPGRGVSVTSLRGITEADSSDEGGDKEQADEAAEGRDGCGRQSARASGRKRAAAGAGKQQQQQQRSNGGGNSSSNRSVWQLASAVSTGAAVVASRAGATAQSIRGSCGAALWPLAEKEKEGEEDIAANDTNNGGAERRRRGQKQAPITALRAALSGLRAKVWNPRGKGSKAWSVITALALLMLLLFGLGNYCYCHHWRWCLFGEGEVPGVDRLSGIMSLGGGPWGEGGGTHASSSSSSSWSSSPLHDIFEGNSAVRDLRLSMQKEDKAIGRLEEDNKRLLRHLEASSAQIETWKEAAREVRAHLEGIHREGARQRLEVSKEVKGDRKESRSGSDVGSDVGMIGRHRLEEDPQQEVAVDGERTSVVGLTALQASLQQSVDRLVQEMSRVESAMLASTQQRLDAGVRASAIDVKDYLLQEDDDDDHAEEKEGAREERRGGGDGEGPHQVEQQGEEADGRSHALRGSGKSGDTVTSSPSQLKVMEEKMQEMNGVMTRIQAVRSMLHGSEAEVVKAVEDFEVLWDDLNTKLTRETLTSHKQAWVDMHWERMALERREKNGGRGGEGGGSGLKEEEKEEEDKEKEEEAFVAHLGDEATLRRQLHDKVAWLAEDLSLAMLQSSTRALEEEVHRAASAAFVAAAGGREKREENEVGAEEEEEEEDGKKDGAEEEEELLHAFVNATEAQYLVSASVEALAATTAAAPSPSGGLSGGGAGVGGGWGGWQWMEEGFPRPDYAALVNGGSVLSGERYTSPTYAAVMLDGLTKVFHDLRVPGYVQGEGPDVVISQGVRMGQCWAFAGSFGHITVALGRPIVPTHVTLEHVPMGRLTLSLNGGSSAPETFRVEGWHHHPETRGERPVVLLEGGEFAPQGMNARAFTHVTVHVESNYGHPDYTCLYGVRVHGQPVSVEEELTVTESPKRLGEEAWRGEGDWGEGEGNWGDGEVDGEGEEYYEEEGEG